MRRVILFLFSLSVCSIAFAGNEAATVYSPITIAKNSNLLIQKGSLDQTEFLLRASLRPQTVSPSSHGLLSRIVTFHRAGPQIFVMSSSQGQVATKDLPSHIILAALPIVDENDSTLTVDFNQGMQKLFTASNWYGSDSNGKDFSPYERDLAVLVDHSFIREATQNVDPVQGVLTLEIKQVAQLNLGSQYFPTYEASYYLSPYQPRTGFVPRENKGFRHFGFFETEPFLEAGSGRSTTLITRWALPAQEQKIKYYISPSTPREYVEAVREGILYWNKAFGRDVLEAVEAPAGVTAPDSRYNIVQWVQWDNAGSAYADALSDPRTGEILNAQVYMTSVFAFSTRANARRLLRELKSRQVKAPTFTSNKHASDLFKNGHLCDMDMAAQLTDTLETALNSGADDSAFLRLSQDFVRGVVAHEVGHTLGLRHNFLGKAALNVSQDEKHQMLLDYLSDNKLPPESLVISSSVMDYLPYDDEVLMDALMNKQPAAEYDRLAIQWAYAPNDAVQPALDLKTAPLFATDSHVHSYGAAFGDVELFTSGKEPIVHAALQMRNGVQELPMQLIETFILAKAPLDARDAKTVGEINLNPEITANRIAAQYERLLQWMKSDARALSVERRYPFVGLTNQLEVRTAQWKWVSDQIQKAGGVEKVFFEPFKSFDAKAAQEELKMRLEKIAQSGFVGADGKTHQFSAEEIKTIQEQSERYFAVLEQKLPLKLLESLSTAKVDYEARLKAGYLSPSKPSVSRDFETQLATLADHILFEESGKSIAGVHKMEPGVEPKIMAPLYKYPFPARLLAVKILSEELGHDAAWSLTGRRAAVEKITAGLTKTLGKDYQKVEAHHLEQPLRTWFLQQVELLKKLAAGFGCQDLLQPKTPPATPGQPPQPPVAPK